VDKSSIVLNISAPQRTRRSSNILNITCTPCEKKFSTSAPPTKTFSYFRPVNRFVHLINCILMAFSKAHLFPAPYYHFSLLCKATSHPARIAILRIIFEDERSAVPVSDFVQAIPLTRPAISAHLKVLRDMHILSCAGKGPAVIYSLNPELPNSNKRIIQLVMKASAAENEALWQEMRALASRRMIGTSPR
jgi:ArsR family transcriptional regulator, arsenate/arsenite/antimonite-responsive transcriptional repressor